MPPNTPDTAAEAKRTNYVILWMAPGAATWTRLAGVVSGSNQKDAIRAAVNRRADTDTKEGDYVAVPDSSWKPTPVTTEQREVINVG